MTNHTTGAQRHNERRLARTMVLGGNQYDAGHRATIVRRMTGICVEIVIDGHQFTVNPRDLMAADRDAPAPVPASEGGAVDDWQPVFSPWRHGGWYVDNLRYPSGAVGCVSRNYSDKKWRIACDPRSFNEQPTYPSRIAAARGERELIAALEGEVARVEVGAKLNGEVAASERPWRVASIIRGRKDEVGAGLRFWIETVDPVLPQVIAEFDSDDLEAQEEIRANFDYIVTAVNSFAAMQEVQKAATALLYRIDNMTSDDFSEGGERDEREALHAALATADKEGGR